MLGKAEVGKISCAKALLGPWYPQWFTAAEKEYDTSIVPKRHFPYTLTD